MDLSNGLVSYNGWTNSLVHAAGVPADGWELISADISNIGVTQYLDKKALQDGMDAIDVFENARTIHLIAGVYGSTKGRFWDNLQTLLHAFNPAIAYNSDTANAGFIALDFVQPTADISTWPTSAYPNGIPLRFYARPAAPPTYALDRARLSGTSGKGLSAQAAITLIAKDPRKYSTNSTSVALTSSTSGISASYKGDYQSIPTLIFDINSAGNSNLTVEISSGIVGFSNPTTLAVIDTSVLSSDVYTLDFLDHTLIGDSDDANHPEAITTLSRVLIDSTITKARYSHGGAFVNSVHLQYREAWV